MLQNKVVKAKQNHKVTINDRVEIVEKWQALNIPSLQFIEYYNTHPEIRVGKVKTVNSSIRKWRIRLESKNLAACEVGAVARRYTHSGYDKKSGDDQEEKKEEEDDFLSRLNKTLDGKDVSGFECLELRETTDAGIGVFATQDIASLGKDRKRWAPELAVCDYRGTSVTVKRANQARYDVEYCLAPAGNTGLCVDAREFPEASFGRYLNCSVYAKNANCAVKAHPRDKNMLSVVVQSIRRKLLKIFLQNIYS